MIGAALRMAGGALANPIGRQIIGGAAATGGVMAAPAVIDFASGDMVDDRLSELTGKKKSDGTYKIGLTDRLLGGIDKLTGGEGISQKTIKSKADDINLQGIKDDAVLSTELERLGVDTDTLRGKTRSQVAAQYAPQIEEGQIRRKAGIERDLRTSDPDYMNPRTMYEIAREDRLQAASDAREDRLLDRRQTLDMNMANLAFKEAESKRQFDLQSKRAHKEKMASIIAGLAGLGGAFAI